MLKNWRLEIRDYLVSSLQFLFLVSEMHALWQLMLETAVSNQNQSLTCSDCYQILEYLSDLCGGCEGKQPLIEAARRHLQQCPDCQTYYEKRLKKLEGSAG